MNKMPPRSFLLGFVLKSTLIFAGAFHMLDEKNTPKDDDQESSEKISQGMGEIGTLLDQVSL